MIFIKKQHVDLCQDASGFGCCVCSGLWRITGILFISSLFFFSSGCSTKEIHPSAENGFLNLSDFNETKVVHLDGYWTIYRQKLLTPEDLAGPNPPIPDGTIQVPGYWPRRYNITYATCVLKIRLNPDHSALALYFGEVNSAYSAWVNGRHVVSVGKVATSRKNEIYKYASQIIPVDASTNDIQLVLQISNFHHCSPGIADRIYLGHQSDIRAKIHKAFGIGLLLSGSLLMIGLYHLLLYIIRLKDPTALYLGLLCIEMGILCLASNTTDGFLVRLLPMLQQQGLNRINVIAASVSLITAIMFIHNLFPGIGFRFAPPLFLLQAVTFSLITLIFPSYVFSHLDSLFNIFALFALVYAIVFSIRAVYQKREGSIIFLVGFLFFTITGVNDILYAGRLIQTGYIMSIGVLILVATFSFLLAFKYQKAFSIAETLSHDLEEKNIALSRMDHLKDEFLATTSHELRTPLHGIIGISESLITGAAGNLSPGLKSNLSLIISSSRRLAKLVNDILDFTRLRNRDISLNKQTVDIHAIASIVIRSLASTISDRDLDIVSHIPPDIPFINGDEDRIQQILYNLMGNAVKFTEKGTVHLSARGLEEMVEISVSDTGRGIPEEDMDRIFEPFEQANPSDNPSIVGTGIGLSITKKLIELHGGKIRAASSLGKGTTFTFTLPRGEDPPAHQGQFLSNGIAEDIHIEEKAERQPELPGLPNAPHMDTTRNDGDFRVMVVDDDPVNLRVVGNYLSTENIPFATAVNGMETLDFFKKGGKADLVLLDIMMPGMTGIEVCEKLRETCSPAELPIIILTAGNRITDFVRAYAYGASDYLTKPFSREELVARVGFHLKMKEGYASMHENYRLQLELHDRALKEENALILAEKATQEMLRFQLNPHFLFNSLASIRGAVAKDPTLARDMISNLAGFCRLVLSRKSMGLSTIKEETALISLYLDIEKVRLGDYLSVSIHTEPDLDNFRIPSFLLQPLVENAVKYGCRTAPDNLDIRVSAGYCLQGSRDRCCLEVANSGTWVEPETGPENNSMGIGIENVNQRLRTSYSGKATVEIIAGDGWVVVRIEIPL